MSSTQDQLYRQLEAQPLVELTGVVSASGCGGAMFAGDRLWSFGFQLVAWRINDGDIQEADLYVRRRVTKVELDAFCRRVNANTVIRLRGRVAMENGYGKPQALLDEFIGEYVADSELNDRLQELLKPVVHSDDFFGDLVLDRSVTSFVGQTTWNGHPVELSLYLDDIAELDDAIKCGRELWADSGNWNQRVLDCIARDLLPLKSENWREDDDSIVSRDAFEARILLRRITVRPDGEFTILYDDDDLFFGHDIVVQGALGSNRLSAGIQG
jgi:hypothetical protein